MYKYELPRELEMLKGYTEKFINNDSLKIPKKKKK